VRSRHEPVFEEAWQARAFAFALLSTRLAVLPYCPFVEGFIDRHREYLDLVPVERRAKFALYDG
jgi:hypothetical protein